MAVSDKLSAQETKQYYSELFFPLLTFVSQQKNLHPGFGEDVANNRVDQQDAVDLMEALYKELSLIDQYIEANDQALSDENKEILKSWKRMKYDTYIIERYLKAGAVFLCEENDGQDEVYLVKGLTDSIRDTFYEQKPLFVQTYLMPFKDVIISCGLYYTRPIMFGGGIKRRFREEYTQAKNEGRYYTKFPE